MTDARELANQLPGIPRDREGPVFNAPWEAQAFALALALHRRGLFSWAEWTAALAAEIRRAQAAGDADTGESYYRHWLAALERILVEKGRVTSPLSRATARPGNMPRSARRMVRRSL